MNSGSLRGYQRPAYVNPARGEWRAACLGLFPFMPIIAIVIAVASFLAWSNGLLWNGWVLIGGLRSSFDWQAPGRVVTLTVALVVAALAWLVGAFLVRGSSAAHRVNARSYGELCERLERLKSRCAIVSQAGGEPANRSPSARQRAACWEVFTNIEQIQAGLEAPGPQWIQRSGYLNAWSLVYRSEEALLELEPIPTVIQDALHDELRLTGSEIQHSEHLLTKLRVAVSTLSAEATPYLISPLPAVHDAATQAAGARVATANAAAATVEAQGLATTNSELQGLAQEATKAAQEAQGALDAAIAAQAAAVAASTRAQVLAQQASRTAAFAAADGQVTPSAVPPIPPIPPAPDEVARAALREVRSSVNNFRQDRWDAFVEARSHLVLAMTLAGLVTFVVLAIALIAGAGAVQVTAAASFFLVGTLVGLINTLVIEGQTGSESRMVNDYGLSRARLYLVPLLSGLVGVAGIVLIAMVPTALAGIAQPAQSGSLPPVPAPPLASPSPVPVASPLTGDLVAQSTPTPAPTPVVPPQPGAAGQVRLPDILNLENYPFGLVLAAIFGLAPGLFVSALKKQADRYGAELQSTEANDRPRT
jgi:hypothetical protein